MGDNLRIAIRLVADGSAFVGDVRLARDEITRLGTAAGATDTALGAHGRAVARLGGEMDALSARSRAVQEAQSGVARTMGMLTSAALALTASLSTAKLVEYADAWSSTASRLRLVTNGADELHAAQQRLFEVAQRTRLSFEATTDTYARFARATQTLHVSGADLLRVTESINKAVAISGGPAASAEAALFQLGQAMASGVLRGEELNSVMEQTPRVAEAIAAGMGRTIGELRQLAEQGKLTADVVFKALLSQGAALDREFAQVTPTVASAFVTLQNAVQKYVGEADQSIGATRALAGSIDTLARNLDGVVGVAGQVALGLTAIGAARMIPSGMQALTRLIDDQKVALYAKAVATVKAATAEKEAAGQALNAAKDRQALTASVLKAAEADYAATFAAQRSAAANLAAAETDITRAKAKMALTNNVYVTGDAMRAEAAAQAAATAAREASIRADDLKAASLARLRLAQAEAAGAATAAAVANNYLTYASEGLDAASVALGQRASVLGAAWGALRTAGSTLLGLVGGPLGAAFLATAGAVTYFATRQTAAEKAAHDHADALRLVASSAEALELKLTKAAGALTNVEKLQAKAKLAQAEENMAATRASLGTANSSTGLLGRWLAIGREASNEIEAVGRQFAGAEFSAEGYAEALAAVAKRHEDDKAVTAYILDMLRTVDAYKAAEADAKKYRDALNGVAAATEAASAYPTRFANKLGELGTKLADVTEKARALRALPGLPRRLEELVGTAPAAPEGMTGYSDRHGVAQDDPYQRFQASKEVAAINLRRLTKAEADDQIRLLGEQVKAEREYQQAVASGNAVEIARATAKKKVAEAVANGFPVEEKAALLTKETELALLGVSGAAGAAATELSAATTATMRLAMAAGAGEAAQRAATYANKEAEASLKGNIALSAIRAANAQEEAAAILTIRNETVRGLELETANTNRLTEAMVAGGEAVRVAQEEEYRLNLIRKLGSDATVAGTKAQQALNDAMAAYRSNRAANDNNRLAQERQTANDNLALAQREIDLMGQAEGVRSRALTTLRNQQEAARKVAELGEDGARQWLAWQEQIADARALVEFQKEVENTAKEMSRDVTEALLDPASDWRDVGRTIGKRLLLGLLENQFVLPVMMQVVGSAPSLFGITSPVAGGQSAAQGGIGGLGIGDALGLGNLLSGTGGVGIGQDIVSTVSEFAFDVTGSAGVAQGLGLGIQAAPWGIIGGLGANLLGLGGKGGVGGMIGGTLGSVAGGAVGSTALGALLGSAAGPVGAIVGSFLGTALGGLIGPNPSVGPNSQGHVVVQDGRFAAGPSYADNDGDPTQVAQATAQLAAQLNTLMDSFGLRSTGQNFGLFAGGEKVDGIGYRTVEELVQAVVARGVTGDGLVGRALSSDKVRSLTSVEDVAGYLQIAQAIEQATAGLADLDATLAGVAAKAKAAAAETYATVDASLAKAGEMGLGDEYRAVLEGQIRSTFVSAGQSFTAIEIQEAQAAAQTDALVEAVRRWGLSLSETEIRANAAAQAEQRRNQVLAEYTASLYQAQGRDYLTTLTGLDATRDTVRRNLAAVGADDAAGRADTLITAQLSNTLSGLSLAALADVTRTLGGSVGVLAETMRDAAQATATEDLTVRTLRAQGRTEEADALELRLSQQRVYAQAVKEGNDAAYLATLKLTQGLEAQSAAAAAAAQSASALRQGIVSIESALDPTWRANLDAQLSEAGLSGGAIEALRPAFQSVLDAASSGAVTAGQMRAAQAALDAQLRAGTITVGQHGAAVSVLTAAWQDSASAAQTAADAVTQTRDRLVQAVDQGWSNAVTRATQQVTSAWQTAANASRQAAVDWTRVGDSMQAALDGLLVNKDLSNLGAQAMLDTTERQFLDAAHTVQDYQAKLLRGVTPTEDERQAAVDAAGKLDALGQRYLEEARAYGLGAVEYDRRLDQVEALWGATRDMSRSLASSETSRAQGLDRQLDWLSRLNDTMSGTGATNAALLERIVAALSAGQTPTQTAADRAGLWMADWFGRYNTLLGDQASGRLSADQVNASGLALWNEKVAQANALSADPAVWRAVVDAARASANGAGTADWFAGLARDKGIPGFAMGGFHAGGPRIVGERGAELEVTGPARYWTADQTRDMLAPRSYSVTVDMAPVVTAVGGVTSAVMDIGRLISDLSSRVTDMAEAIADLSRSHGQLAVQVRRLAVQ
ncbi:tape measure protein [Azospirillum agricola]|uniref:tape measure protein n=1 Tax=Azospirillum agricola TaxID=1720247 RepID=UPI000A0F2579|nr:tape measure protein [Azospirillum agricola]SMH62837.1 tape measure domain-containing protein [Azospirillum lipoferum]